MLKFFNSHLKIKINKYFKYISWSNLGQLIKILKKFYSYAKTDLYIYPEKSCLSLFLWILEYFFKYSTSICFSYSGMFLHLSRPYWCFCFSLLQKDFFFVHMHVDTCFFSSSEGSWYLSHAFFFGNLSLLRQLFYINWKKHLKK